MIAHAKGLLAIGGAVMCAACAGTDGASNLSTLLKSAGETASTATATTVLPLGNSPSVQGTPVMVYERVARGVLTCWFGGLGPLKKTHIFNADATPPSQGSAADISIHERELNPLPNQTPRGARAFRIWFERESESTTRLRLEAFKLPQDLAQAMERDAVAWAVEKASCDAQVVRPPPPPPHQPEKAKVKKRAKPPSR